MKTKLVIAAIGLLYAGSLSAQNTSDAFTISSNTNQMGMFVLGGWALANFAYGGYEWAKRSDSRKYFGQMNVMWNVVNAGIAGFALYQHFNTDVSMLSPQDMLDKHNQTINLYLINAGLDVLYAAGGWCMIRASKTSEKYSHLLKGYGQSVILQASFLFTFDLAMYFIQMNNSSNFNIPLQSFALGVNGISFTIAF
ncbi:MAG: hypothetical protein PHT92_09665 [Bacteroidales bacterium]|nr:hypothetical protein [Bacteroidales bacterium]